MPIYEYECKNGHRFEKLAKLDSSNPKCPQCKSKKTEQVLSVPAKRNPLYGLQT